MAITEGPRTFSEGAPWRGTRRFYIDHDPAIDPLSIAGLPARDDEWPGWSAVLCLGSEIEESKPGGWTVVRSDYAFVPDGVVDAGGDPVDWTPRITMKTMEITAPFDVDLDGRPYVNTALDPVDPGLRRVTFKRVEYRRYERFYDTARSDAFENRQNSKQVLIGPWTVKPYHMRLNSYSLVGECSLAARFVPVAYEIDFFLTDALGARPFDHPYLNQGKNGWYDDGTNKQRGRFVTAGPSPGYEFRDVVDMPVRLDVDGMPLNSVADYSKIRVGSVFSNSQKTYAPAATPGEKMPTYLLFEDLRDKQNKLTGHRLWFRATLEADLNELGL
jgi:hypothetical protein